MKHDNSGSLGVTHQKKEQKELLKKLLQPLEPIPTGLQVQPFVVQPKAVIFDIYGTLLISAAGDVGPDSAEDNEQAFLQAMIDAGLECKGGKETGTQYIKEEIAKVHLKKKRMGIQFPEIDILHIWLNVLSQLGVRGAEFWRVERAALSYECRINPVWSMPGLRETLAALHARGVRLGILSNAQFYTPILLEFLCDRSLEALGFDPDLSLFSYREGEGKPSSNLFTKLASRLNTCRIQDSEVLYVGNDMLKDIWPAANVGWKTALFAGDRRSLRLREQDPRVTTVQPDLIIDALRQLLSF